MPTTKVKRIWGGGTTDALRQVVAEYNKLAGDFAHLKDLAEGDQVLTAAVLSINANAAKFDVAAGFAVADGHPTNVAAQAAEVFTAAHVVNGTKYGIVGIYADITGDISTAVAVSPQVYDSIEAAFAALPATAAGKALIGWIVIDADATTWTANTDDMTGGSDVDAAYFITRSPFNWTDRDEAVCVVTAITLAIDAAAEKFKWAAAGVMRIGSLDFILPSKTAQVFSSAYTVNDAAGASKLWGAFLVQVNAAGVVSTKACQADQIFTTEALAIEHLPAADSGNVAIGYITVQNKASAKWTANTDDMTPASDCEDSNFYSTAAEADVGPFHQLFEVV